VQDPFLSIVIPAYNEESCISDTLKKVIEYLNTQSYSWEVLVADDGSTDSTAQLARNMSKLEPRIRLISIIHKGKGWAVKQGMLAATGEYRFQCDADLSMPIEQISRFLPPQIEQFDIAIGSREAIGANRIGESKGRQLRGRIFNFLVRTLAVSGLQDTQCGFKCFRGTEAQTLFSIQRLHRLTFDVEVLTLAKTRGLNVIEIPIDWYHKPSSKIRTIIDPILMIRDLLYIRWGIIRGMYRSVGTNQSRYPDPDHSKIRKS